MASFLRETMNCQFSYYFHYLNIKLWVKVTTGALYISRHIAKVQLEPIIFPGPQE